MHAAGKKIKNNKKGRENGIFVQNPRKRGEAECGGGTGARRGEEKYKFRHMFMAVLAVHPLENKVNLNYNILASPLWTHIVKEEELMKKILAILLAMMMLIGMMSFASAEEEKPLIGILAPETTHAWVSGVAYYAQQKAEELELNYVMMTGAEAEELSNYMDQMVDMGAKAILLWTQFDGMQLAAERALEKGVIIYNFDMIVEVDEKYADQMYVLTGNNKGMGVAGAEYIAEKLEGAGKVLVLNNPNSANINDDRVAGFEETIADIAPDIEIIGYVPTDFTREGGLNDMADALNTYPEIDAVYSIDDESSLGALQAIKDANRTDIKAITGGGGCQGYFEWMLQEENQDIWACSLTYSPIMIQTCVENIVKVLEGEEVEHLIVHPTSVIDRTTAADYLDPTSPY